MGFQRQDCSVLGSVFVLVLFGLTSAEVYERIPASVHQTWERTAGHLKLSSHIDKSQTWQASALMNWYFVSGVDYKCEDIEPMGNWHICQTPPFTIKKPCLVYSFGIANDFSFDGKLGTRVGCEVHSFDPSMLRGDFQYSKEVMFHAIGLSDKDNDSFEPKRDSYVRERQVWKMRTLKSLMKDLGHENRVIDVLKMDIEGHEWAVLKNILDDGLAPKIRQFSLEWHVFGGFPPRDTYFKLYETIQRFTESGFLTFRKKMGTHSYSANSYYAQCDMSLVNARFQG